MTGVTTVQVVSSTTDFPSVELNLTHIDDIHEHREFEYIDVLGIVFMA